MARYKLILILLIATACAPSNPLIPPPATLLAQVSTPDPSLPTCPPEEISAALDALPPYQPTDLIRFVRVSGSLLTLDGAPYLVRGINYYPSRYPWRRFLTQTDTATLDHELGILQAANINTLRVFLWNEVLFRCPGSGAVPNAEAFIRFDTVIARAAAHGMRLIVTLNDLADLEQIPLYTSPAHIDAQTRFIVERYRDEAAIMAWDLRNEGDIDYGSNNSARLRFDRQMVLTWLGRTSALVRDVERNHLLTAGWLYDNEATIPFVDFVSFHHWNSAGEMQERIVRLRAATDKPVLLEEIGYSTQRVSYADQARLLSEVIRAVEENRAVGWMIWTAFDFPTDATCVPPACPSPDNAEHYFGLWTVDYEPKPAVAVISESR